MLDHDRDVELARTIMDLPIKYREVILLYYYEEYDTSEISVIPWPKAEYSKNQTYSRKGFG
ncbi:sigma factor-like helix-turn-helix DNA-binding protein [Bacillus infantis]|uniref:sigma factor-like helix-turn-helix DNA-binding protein n=1 Tax=Bacillus infantis TaxID=324767 RepID=UPI003CEB8A6B